MLLRAVSVPDTRITNVSSVALFQVSMVFVLSWNKQLLNILLKIPC